MLFPTRKRRQDTGMEWQSLSGNQQNVQRFRADTVLENLSLAIKICEAESVLCVGENCVVSETESNVFFLASDLSIQHLFVLMERIHYVVFVYALAG
jgi:hypothetical protein